MTKTKQLDCCLIYLFIKLFPFILQVFIDYVPCARQAMCFKVSGPETTSTVAEVKIGRLFIDVKLHVQIKCYLYCSVIYLPNNFTTIIFFYFQGAFSGWKVILHVANQSREAGFKRLLQSGGAKVCIESTY